MIEVCNLSKRFSGSVAVDNISFTVGRGEIVGLLGPNGAGKTTTMRIIAGYLSATSGTARVAGLDVFKDTLEVRRRIGYMPESNPLHLDMRVREYLKFRARLKGLSWRESRKRVDLMIQQCGLTEVRDRIIGQLSKGYKQRVGLADALVHNPDLIILDEPTIGLDPNQIRSVRHLIKNLAGKHTILLSTHNLTEVEMTCHRILILAGGKILASDTPENLQRLLSGSGNIIAEISGNMDSIKGFFEANPDIEDYSIEPVDGSFYRCSIIPREGVELRTTIFETAAKNGWKLRELTKARCTLEDVFWSLTKGKKEEGR